MVGMQTVVPERSLLLKAALICNTEVAQYKGTDSTCLRLSCGKGMAEGGVILYASSDITTVEGQLEPSFGFNLEWNME
jgi:hypothetical protein